MVHAQGGGPVAADGVQAHQVTVGAFMQWIVAQQALGATDRSLVVAFLLLQFDEPLQRIKHGLAQAIALGQYPLVVATGKQVSPVQLPSRLQSMTGPTTIPGPVRLRQRLLEIPYIQRPGSLRRTRLP